MITYVDMETKVETTKTFDVVVLCNGHYTVGHIPHIPGIESFPSGSIHSHQYRKPEVYAKKKVCILGASWSGIDIAMEVSQYAEKVHEMLLGVTSSGLVSKRSVLSCLVSERSVLSCLVSTFTHANARKTNFIAYCARQCMNYIAIRENFVCM